MSAEMSFRELVERVRAGDNDACTELERRYGDELRRVARVRLARQQLQNPVNPSDIVQSVMYRFFLKASEGEYSFNEPDDVIKLLTTMVNRKINDHRKKDAAEKRNGVLPPPPPPPSPSTAVALKELFEKIWISLEPEDQALARLKVWEDLPWNEIGSRLGTSAEAARKRFGRLCDSARERWMRENGDV